MTVTDKDEQNRTCEVTATAFRRSTAPQADEHGCWACSRGMRKIKSNVTGGHTKDEETDSDCETVITAL